MLHPTRQNVLQAAPVQGTERMDALDAVRGAAVLGILLANIIPMSGLAFVAPDHYRSLPLAAWHPSAYFLVLFLIEAKLYSLFSLVARIRGGPAPVVAACQRPAARVCSGRADGPHELPAAERRRARNLLRDRLRAVRTSPLGDTLGGAVAFFGLQMMASRAWLASAAFGPVEWLWRMYTYRRRVPLFR